MLRTIGARVVFDAARLLHPLNESAPATGDILVLHMLNSLDIPKVLSLRLVDEVVQIY